MANSRYFPEPDTMFDSPRVITIPRSNGYNVIGFGIGITGRQYPADLPEIIPASPEVLHRRWCTGHKLNVQ